MHNIDKGIKRNLLALLCHFGVLMALFVLIQKPLFYLYNRNFDSQGASFSSLIEIIAHGLKIDTAAAAYLTFVPALLMLAGALAKRLNVRKAVKVYDAVIAVLLGLLIMADTSLYAFWSFKIDPSVLSYLKEPKEAFASVNAGFIIVRTAAAAAIALATYAGLAAAARLIVPLERRGWRPAVVYLLATGLLFGVARGFIGRPYNPSNAYFGSDMYRNHSALNPVFNFIYLASRNNDFKSQYRAVSEERRAEIFARLYPREKEGGEMVMAPLRSEHPDVVLIVLEGMGAKLIESLGGEKGVSPRIDSIAAEGVTFRKCYASSVATDRGIVCLLSGYHGFPTMSIMRYVSKLPNLPGMARAMGREGYHSRFVYGGDPSFRNMAAYLYSTGFNEIVGGSGITAGDGEKTEWGVADGPTLDHTLGLIKADREAGRRSFTTVLTLSSHDPWDVPYKKLADARLNAYAYTDSCVGAFVENLKALPKWDNTLVVITADHGPHSSSPTDPEYPHIPFILAGGALDAPAQLDMVCSQADIAATVLGLVGASHDEFPFSRDVLRKDYGPQFAYFSFNNGFAMIDSTGTVVYDNVAQQPLVGSDTTRILQGKVILQTTYDDIADR